MLNEIENVLYNFLKFYTILFFVKINFYFNCKVCLVIEMAKGNTSTR